MGGQVEISVKGKMMEKSFCKLKINCDVTASNLKVDQQDFELMILDLNSDIYTNLEVFKNLYVKYKAGALSLRPAIRTFNGNVKKLIINENRTSFQLKCDIMISLH